MNGQPRGGAQRSLKTTFREAEEQLRLVHEQASRMCRYDVDVVSPAGEVKTINMYSKHQPVQLATVGQLKKKALKAFDTARYLGDVRLIVQGKPLEDDSASLSECEIKPKTVVQMVTKVNGG